MAKSYEYNFGGQTYRSPKQLSQEEQTQLVKNYHDAGLLDAEGLQQQEFSRTDNLNNPTLLDAFRTFDAAEKGYEDPALNNDEEALEQYYQRMRYFTANTGSALKLAANLRGNQFTEDERQALAVMYNVWDNTVPFYKEKNRKWEAVGDFAEAIITDPFTLAGVATGGMATMFSQAGKQAAQLGLRQSIAQSFKTGAKWGVYEGGLVGGVHHVGESEAKENIGIGDGASLGSTAKAAGYSAAAGGVLGGALGGIGGAVKGMGGKAKPTDTVKVDTTGNLNSTSKLPNADSTIKSTPEQLKANMTAAEQRVASRQGQGKEREASRQAGLEQFKQGVVGNLANILQKQQRAGTFEERVQADFGTLVKKWKLKDKATDSSEPYSLDDFIYKAATETQIPDGFDRSSYQAIIQTAETAAHARLIKSETNPDLFVPHAQEFELLAAKAEMFTTEGGRFLREAQNKLDVNVASDRLDKWQQVEYFDQLSKTTDVAAARKVVAGMKDIQVGKGTKVVGVMNDVFVHNILGAGSTLAVNTTSSFAHQQYRTFQRMVGDAMMGDKLAFRKAMVDWQLQWQHLTESAKMAAHTLNTSKGIISPYRTAFDAFDSSKNKNNDAGVVLGNREMTAQTLGKQEGESAGMYAANLIGNTNRFIGRRAMVTTDEFMKQQAFRTFVKRDLIERNLDEGMDMKAAFQKADEAGKKIIQQHIEDMALGRKPIEGTLAARALNEANIVTFQNEMAKDVFGMFGRAGQDLRTKFPVLTQLLPFVRTPSNLMSFVGDRTPVLQYFSRELKDKLESPDPKVASEAQAAMAIGSAMWAGVFMMAGSGMIIGKAPEDRGRAAAEGLRDDYLPYSLRIDGKVYNVRRLDPAARFMMVAGSIHDTIMYENDATMLEEFSKYSLGAVKTILEIPTLQGIKGVANFLGDDKKESGDTVRKGVLRHLQGYMPYYRFVEEFHFATGNEVFKAEITDIEGVLKGKPSLAYLSSTGYWNGTDIQRDWYLGEPIVKNPTVGAFSGITTKKKFEEAEVKYEEVVDEFSRIGYNLTRPASKQSLWAGADLKKIQAYDNYNRSYYDVYEELVGKVQDSKTGLTLNEAMHRLINSSYYSKLRDPTYGKGFKDKNTKATAITALIREYRQMAAYEVLKSLQNNEDYIQRTAFKTNRIFN